MPLDGSHLLIIFRLVLDLFDKHCYPTTYEPKLLSKEVAWCGIRVPY